MTAPPTQTVRPSGGELTSAQWSMTITPVVAAVTTLCASLALAGVIEGLRWWGYAGVAVTVVTAVGLGLRAVRTPILLVGIGQIFALLCLLVILFTNTGILGFLPGPAAISSLTDVLGNSVEVVRTGVPPVSATQAVLCLVVIAIGMVAVLVDTLAVSAGTPAACGLVLLCVYAVPASLADDLLPWWAFVLGAVSFAALLAVDGAHRHQQWRNRPVVQGTSGGIGSPTMLVSAAVAVALIAGATVTVIGTVGQLPGGTGGGGAGGLGGLNPFTSLRGMLDQDDNVELFRVRNLGEEPRYLRALTLPEYNRNGGWSRGTSQLPRGFPADRLLPPQPGEDVTGATATVDIEIEPINSQDIWAPVFGSPRRMRNLPDGMRYDPDGGMVYGPESQRLPAYTEEADLTEPSAADLRAAGLFTSTGDIDRAYLKKQNLSDAVLELAADLTAGKTTMFDQVHAIQDYFDVSNGFKYETQTATGSDEDALEDFLFRGKAGFCEQYASSMAILLRAADIPSRVAMGYTAGYPNGDYRTITTQNAHAWVEVFFPGSGWVSFDPTPLTDGTTYEPPYASDSGSSTPSDDPEASTGESTPQTAPSAPSDNPQDEEGTDAAGAGDKQEEDDSNQWLVWAIAATAVLAIALTASAMFGSGGGRRRDRGGGGGADPPSRPQAWLLPLAVVAWALVLVFGAALLSWWLAALAAVLLVAAAPGLIRERRRVSRRHAVHGRGPAAATSAWRELLAESADRGAEVVDTETVRTSARRLAREHALDDDGKRALRTVVSEVERSWYGARSAPDPALAPAFDDLIHGLRRSDPLTLRARLLPRSVLRRRR